MLPLLYKRYRNAPTQPCSNREHNGGFLPLLFSLHIQYLRQSLFFPLIFLGLWTHIKTKIYSFLFDTGSMITDTKHRRILILCVLDRASL